MQLRDRHAREIESRKLLAASGPRISNTPTFAEREPSPPAEISKRELNRDVLITVERYYVSVHCVSTRLTTTLDQRNSILTSRAIPRIK